MKAVIDLLNGAASVAMLQHLLIPHAQKPD